MNTKINNILSLYGLRKKASINSENLDDVCAYLFLSKFMTPFEEWPAFKAGIIDTNGNILLSRRQFTTQQHKAFTKLDLVVLRMKKSFERTPQGAYLNRMPAQTIASILLREADVPTNTMGSQNIAQKDILLKPRMIKRKQLLPQSNNQTRE